MARKLMFLAMVAVLAFGAMGAVSTQWGQGLVIGGLVTTASFDVHLTNAQAVQNANNGLSTCTAVLDPAPAHIITLNIAKAVPGYKCTINFEVNNAGDVPVKFDDPMAWMEIPAAFVPYASYACSSDVLAAHTSRACSIVFDMPSDIDEGAEWNGYPATAAGLSGSLTLSPVARQYTPAQ